MSPQTTISFKFLEKIFIAHSKLYLYENEKNCLFRSKNAIICPLSFFFFIAFQNNSSASKPCVRDSSRGNLKVSNRAYFLVCGLLCCIRSPMAMLEFCIKTSAIFFPVPPMQGKSQ